jgi:hypothetical protein
MSWLTLTDAATVTGLLSSVGEQIVEGVIEKLFKVITLCALSLPKP